MSLLHSVVGWLVFCVPSTLCCWLVSVYVKCPFYTVVWVGQCLCSVSLLHCVVGWSVIVFCVPSTLCCGLVCDCVFVPSTLCCGLVGVLCPFYTVLWVGQCLCSVSLLHCVVG